MSLGLCFFFLRLAPDGHYVGNDPVQLEKINVYYSETKNDCFVPRALLIDMEKSVLNHITSNTFGQMFRSENFLSSTEGSANCFNNGGFFFFLFMVGDGVVNAAKPRPNGQNVYIKIDDLRGSWL